MSYDDDLTDGIGIDCTYAAKLAQLAASGTVFGPGSTGSAVAVTNPEGETTVRISDGIGRIVMSIDVEGNTSIISHDELITPVQLASSQQPPVQLASSQLESITYTAHDANSNRIATRSPAGGGNGSAPEKTSGQTF